MLVYAAQLHTTTQVQLFQPIFLFGGEILLESWIGDVVGVMHIAGVEHRQLAERMGVTPGYISMILNGKKSPDGAERRIREALRAILDEKAGKEEQ